MPHGSASAWFNESMKCRGPCQHQPSLPVPPSGSALTPAPRSPLRPAALARRASTSACLRLYAQAQEQREHKELLFRQFGLRRVSSSGLTTPPSDSRLQTTRDSSKPTIATTAKSYGFRHVPVSGDITRGSRIADTAFNRGSTNPKAGRTASERRGSGLYLPCGRSPAVVASATASTTKSFVARTYSLQSTVASRAAVTPRRALNNRRTPPSLTATMQTPISGRPAAVNSTSNSRRPSSPNTSKPGGLQPRNSVVPSSPGSGLTARTRARMVVTPRSDFSSARQRSSIMSTTQQRRLSTLPLQQPQQPPPSPVLIHVSRRTSSPILAPASGGGVCRRPSVAPIPPVLSVISGGGGSSEVVSSDATSLLSPQGRRASLLRRDNRLEKLQEQVNVLKATLGLSDEDLQWRVESTRGNAFLAAEQHLVACEERFDRLAFEMQELSQPTRCAHEDEANVALAAKLRSLERQAPQIADWKLQLAACQSELATAKKELLATRVEAELQRAKLNTAAAATASELEQLASRRLESSKEALLAAQLQFKTGQAALQTLLEALGAETDRFAASVASESTSSTTTETLDVKRSLLATLRTIPECASGSDRLSSLCSQAAQLASKIMLSRARDLKRTESEMERAMRDVEVWKTRRDQAKEFSDEMRKREATWQVRQREANDTSLAILRALIPSDIADLSVESLITRARETEAGVLYTYELATYLKTNRFLHWLVTHEDDIARSNFLAVDSAPFFLDFAGYDIQELRALARVLPESFAFDKDGRKRAWRATFMEHVRLLTAQQQRQTIKAGWDPVRRARRDVQLPELTARQQLNPVFCYPSDAEMEAKLVKFQRQQARLEAKRLRLVKLEDELVPQAKAEYVAVAEDARNEELQRVFGKNTLISLRDDAKQQHLALCKERDAVKSELAHGQRAWEAQTPSFEQYQAEVELIHGLKAEIRSVPRILGPFPATSDVQPRERAAFKKLSVEEEAEARKRELDSAIARRSQDINDVATAAIEQSDVAAAAAVESAIVTGREAEAQRLMQLEDKEVVATKETLVDTPGEIETLPPRGFQKVKSLCVAVGVLQFLERDFCSPTRASQGKSSGQQSAKPPSHNTEISEPKTTELATSEGGDGEVKTPRSFRKTPSASSSGIVKEENSTPVVVASVIVPPKSKALLKLVEARRAQEASSSPLVEGSEEKAPRPSPFGGGKGNFLAELQSRSQRKKPSAEGSTTSVEGKTTASDSGEKPTNFLDELKRASARKNSNTDEVIGAVEPPPTLKTAVISAPPAPRSFLDELKARATAT